MNPIYTTALLDRNFSPIRIKELIDEIDNNLNNEIYDTEGAANAAWAIKSALELKVFYLKFFKLLKNRDHYNAWFMLERTEITLKFLRENITEALFDEFRLAFYAHYIPNWQSLFPYTVFFSPGMSVGYYTCSICGAVQKPRSRCSHKKGKVHNGKLCLHEGHDFNFLEVSLVSNPVQKYSVLMMDYDYTIINYLSNNLESPYDGWQKYEGTRTYDRKLFTNISDSDPCPCKKNGLQFGLCCSNKDNITIPHINILLEKEISPENKVDYFPYGS